MGPLPSLFLAVAAAICAILYVVHRCLKPIVPTVGTTNIPGPVKARKWPIVGHALWFWKVTNLKDLYEVIWRICEKRDKLMSLYLGKKLLIVVLDAEILEAVINNSNKCQNKEPDLYGQINTFSNGLFSKNGKGWSAMRRPLDRFLHPKNMDNFYKTIMEKAEVLCMKVGNHCGQGVFDVRHLMDLCTTDIILELFLNTPGTQQVEDTLHLAERCSKVVELLFDRILKIQYKNDWVYSWSSSGRRLSNIREDTRPVFKEMVTNCFKKMETDGRDPSDPNFVPENYLEVAIQTNIIEKNSEDNLLFSFMDFIEAGYDTSSTTVSTALLYLAMHPEYQERAYQEQMEVMNGSLEVPSRKDLTKMIFLERIVNETLRHVSVPGIARTVSSQFTIDGYVFPEGATIYIFNNYLFNDPRHWERPKDFYPDHFLPEKVAARHKCAFLPFAFGGRSCPGKQFGTLTTKLLLAMLLRRYKFTTTLKYEEMEYKYMIMVESVKGYPVQVTSR